MTQNAGEVRVDIESGTPQVPGSLERLAAASRVLKLAFVRGADAAAPGLSRAQTPLIDALRETGLYDLRDVAQVIQPGEKFLFPYMYGALPIQMAARSADVVHIANSWYAHLIPLLRCPTVVTCHDLIQVPGSAASRAAYRFHRRAHVRAAARSMRRATAVVCDSKAVADRLISVFPELSARTHVVYLGIGAQFTPGAPQTKALAGLGVRWPYILYVGSEQPRKNLATLVAAFARARQRIPELQLVKVGKHQNAAGRAHLMHDLAASGSLEHAVVLDSVTDEQLVGLYRGATASALLSLDEGFGFPALEAMACGCPTLLSNAPALVEVAGGAAVIVDAMDVTAVAKTIVRLCADADFRQDVGERGLGRARHFTWARAASEYGVVYRSVVDSA